ncbi:hypothetical protein J7L05_03480 [bacterium]|nr:hypothetical protein [bacterium]
MDAKKKNKLLIIRLLIVLVPALLIIAWLAFNSILNNSMLGNGLGIYPPSPGLGNVIYIQPVGNIDDDTLAAVSEMIAHDLKHPVKILNQIEIPHFPEGRVGQVKADFIRNYITDERGVPKDTFRLIALTNEDIYAEGYNFIFGQAAMGGLIGLVSLNRLKPASDGGELIDAQHREIYHERIRKLVRHELGHTFGLTHCSNPECVMAFHDSLATLDSGGEFFCDKCLEKLADMNIKIGQ